MFWSIKQILGLSFWIILFIGVLILIKFKAMDFFSEEQYAAIPVDVILTVFAAIIGGMFTILGVEKTFKEQSKKDFINVFPLKIRHMDNMVEQLEELKSITNTVNVPLLVTRRNFIESLFTDATEVDGHMYFKIRDAHSNFSSIVDKMYHAPEKFCSIDSWGVWSIDEGKEEKYRQKLVEANKIVVDLESLVKERRENFIEHYDKNLDDEIYKRING